MRKVRSGALVIDLMYDNPGTCWHWVLGLERGGGGLSVCSEEERKGVTVDERRKGVIVRKSGGGALMYSGGQMRVVSYSFVPQWSSLGSTHSERPRESISSTQRYWNQKVSRQVGSWARRRWFEWFRNIDCVICAAVWGGFALNSEFCLHVWGWLLGLEPCSVNIRPRRSSTQLIGPQQASWVHLYRREQLLWGALGHYRVCQGFRATNKGSATWFWYPFLSRLWSFELWWFLSNKKGLCRHFPFGIGYFFIIGQHVALFILGLVLVRIEENTNLDRCVLIFRHFWST